MDLSTSASWPLLPSKWKSNFFIQLFTIFAGSVIVTSLFWLLLPPSYRINESSDFTLFYEPVARNLLAGRGLSLSNAPAFRYPPGYPAILGILYAIANGLSLPAPLVLSVFTLVCMGFVSVIIYLLALSIWKNSISLFAPLLWITSPITLWLTKQPNSEIPFLVLFFGAILALWFIIQRRLYDKRLLLFTGILIGIATLIRPVAFGLTLIFSFVIWGRSHELAAKEKLLLVVFFLTGTLAVVLPWEIWISAQTNEFVFISSGGIPSIRDGLTFAVNSGGYRQAIALPEDVLRLMQEAMNRISAGELNSLSEIVSWSSRALFDHPVTFGKLIVIKAFRSWYATDSGRLEVPILFIQIIYLTLILSGSIYAWRLGGLEKSLTIITWVITLYFWMVTILVLSIVRYMLPALGLLFILAPGALPLLSFLSRRYHANKELVHPSAE